MRDAFLILSTLLLLLLFVQSSSIQVSSQKKTLGVKLERDPSGLPGTSFAQTSQHSNNHIANTSNSDTNMIISSIDTEELGDGTCDPPCLNGGLCSEAVCYCPDYTTGSRCQDQLDAVPRYYAAAYLAICIGTFILGIFSAICCRLAYEQHHESDEDTNLPISKKYRDVLKFGSEYTGKHSATYSGMGTATTRATPL